MEPRTDPVIALAVRAALDLDVQIPANRIRSTVSDGHVTLTGDVSYCRQRDRAERTVRRVPGVEEVSNTIRVETPKLASIEVRRAIADALVRRARREAKRIGVDVLDGQVCLSGQVCSWAERQAIVAEILKTPGVEDLDDQLRINPYASP